VRSASCCEDQEPDLIRALERLVIKYRKAGIIGQSTVHEYVDD
jgi:hypothetical protein